MEFRIDARRFALMLLAAAVLLVAAHVAVMISRYVLGHGRLLGLVDTFDLNYENNIPTFFSAFLLVSCAVLLAVLSGRSTVAARDAGYWRWLSFIFLFLAADEDASLHELLIDPIRRWLPLQGPLYFAWVIPYGLALMVVAGLYLAFILRLPARTRWLVFTAGGLYLAGALGFELIGGWYWSRHDESPDLPYALLVAGEEFLEMCGVILFVYTLLDFISAELRGDSLRVLIRSRQE